MRFSCATILIACLSASSLFAAPRVPPNEDAVRETASLRDRYGPQVSIAWNAQTGFVQHLCDFNGQQAPGPKPTDEPGYVHAAHNFIDSFPSLFGYDTEVLRLDNVAFLELAHLGTTDKVAVHFSQVVENIEVFAGWVTVLFDANGCLLSVDNHGLPGVQDTVGLVFPSIDAERAADFAKAAFGRNVDSVLSSHYAIYPAELDGGATARPAWFIHLRAVEMERGIPVQLEYVIDAKNGNILDQWSTVHEVDLVGNTEGWVSPGECPDWSENTEVLVPLRDVRMSSAVGSDETDENGNFTISYAGNNDQNVTASFGSDSTYIWVDDRSGPDIALTQSVTPGVPAQFTMNQGRSEADTAETNIQHWTTMQRQWIKSIAPSDNTMDFRIRANANWSNCCSAYWDGSSTNYFLSGCGCPNTAYSSVILHENGHAVIQRYNGGVTGAFNEGQADIWALYILDTNVLGKDLFGRGTLRRDGNNNRDKCPDDCDEDCHGGEVHDEGEVLMGAFWRMRERLNASLGDAPGDSVADALFLSWLRSFDDRRICNAIYTHILILDDDDGNITNGTPHCADIEGAFEQDKGWPDMHGCSPPQDCPAPCSNPINYGSGTAGSGGFTPHITFNNGCSYVGNLNFQLLAEDTLGGASGVLLFGLNSANVNQGGWTRLVDLGLVGRLIPVNYSGSGAGNGTFTFSAPIPNNPLLDGLRAFFQFTVNDPGAPSGIAASEGLEILICTPN